ncbi:uncharacterized protein CMU_028310 [Cryptosporidium muris RN66]|uniref:Uncharacterized protein n=1 Tax=Cryptosporidium muris (strain RN66) TaxID=441375 RepID=B6AK61_CRYMR|nr:uncharacterized protein CMU_028310 [Cryptosporidium muris RN66]EEA08602.1 hypothetical protein CMU_028310 [Cryptosporidium muris RN66]|eukprot:XP_002142951.1 hypothetical protein [Cryptosporidium muris RN66]
MGLNIRSNVSFTSLGTELLNKSSDDLEKDYEEVTLKLFHLLADLELYRKEWSSYCDSNLDSYEDDDFCPTLNKVIKKISNKVSSYTHIQSVIRNCLAKRSFEELDND